MTLAQLRREYDYRRRLVENAARARNAPWYQKERTVQSIAQACCVAAGSGALTKEANRRNSLDVRASV